MNTARRRLITALAVAFPLLCTVAAGGGLHGTVEVGYSPVHNYEAGPQYFSAHAIRGDVLLTWRPILLQGDYTHMLFDEGSASVLHGALGYRIYSGTCFPDFYPLVGYLRTTALPLDSLAYNQAHSGPVVGGMMKMDLAWLFDGDASLVATYSPTEKAIYKNMKVGWTINQIGISVGGIGMRVPNGRFYSGFTLGLCYRW